MTTRKVVIVGQGYVGLPVAMRAAEVGHDVVGIDSDPLRVNSLRAGTSFVEDVSSERVAAALAAGRYTASGDYADAGGFEVAVITVPTPLREGAPDLSHIETSAARLAPHVRRGSLVVLESTTYPGTTEELLVPVLEAGSGLRAGADFMVGYSPERIDPGNTTWSLENTPKVVSGIDEASLAAVARFYESLVERTVAVKGCKEAELTKLLENTFRHVNIALVNELAIFARQLGIDVWDAIDAASTKPFGYMRFTPGPGVGGHCLPIDPSYLSWRVEQSLGHQFRFVNLANDVNEHMPDHVMSRVTLALNERSKAVKGSRILLVGLAYKKNSGDARESPAVRVARLFLDLGAEVDAVDPMLTVVPRGAESVNLVGGDAIDYASYDAVVVLTDHDAIDWGRVGSQSRYIFDARRRLPAAGNVEHL